MHRKNENCSTLAPKMPHQRQKKHETLKRIITEHSESVSGVKLGHMRFTSPEMTLRWIGQRASINCLSLVVYFAVYNMSEALFTCTAHGAVGGCGLKGDI